MRRRILLLNWQDITHPLAGGAEVHAHEIFRRIADAGHQVTQLSCGYAGARRQEVLDGIEVFRYGRRPTFNLVLPYAYQRLRRTRRFDIVFDDINKIPFYSPLFVEEPLVAIIHHLFGSSIFLETAGPQAAYVSLTERVIPAVYKKTRFIAVSESTRKELAQSGLKCTSDDIVHNAVDHSAYFVEGNLKSASPLIGYLGRLKRYKCIEHLIAALSLVAERVPGVQLLVVGEGDHREKLEAYSDRLGVSQIVRFTGTVSHEHKVQFLNQMWVVGNPSMKEGWGITVTEANACGVPVVAADSPGLRDSVVDGKTGLLYPWGDIGLLADRLTCVLVDEQLRTRLGRGALRWARKFNWNDSAEKTLKIIENVLGS